MAPIGIRLEADQLIDHLYGTEATEINSKKFIQFVLAVAAINEINSTI